MAPDEEGKAEVVVVGDASSLSVAALRAELAALDAQVHALRLRRSAICEALQARGGERHAAWVSAASAAAAAHFGAPQPRLHALLAECLTRLPRVRHRTESRKYYDPAWGIEVLSYSWRGRPLRWERWNNLCHETLHEMHDAGPRGFLRPMPDEECVLTAAEALRAREKVVAAAAGDVAGSVARAAEDAVDVLASFGDDLPEEVWLPAIAIALLGFPEDCDWHALPFGAAADAHEALCHDDDGCDASGSDEEEEE
jgi:hypothetical protein